MFFNSNICPYCKEKINGFIACRLCSKDLKKLINKNWGSTKDCYFFTAAFKYKEIVRDSILNFKFLKNISFCKSFCEFMAAIKIDKFDVLVCVPTFKKQFNPSKEIAKVLKKKIKIKFCPNAVKKIKQTKDQHNCKFNERQTNLKDAFVANPKKVVGKSILICDDVITTACTIQEIAKSCKKAGAKKVGAISFAVSEFMFN